MECFQLDQLLKVARRENNRLRSWLYVNPLQGKHIPVSPSKALDLFSALARLLEEQCPSERILVIGFAETATAIGLGVACRAANVRFCMTTTREPVRDTDFLFFTESHSHATQQRLALRGLEACLTETDRVVFVEDEVTTGNTIEKGIRAIQQAYPQWKGGFGILSILNSMSPQRLEQLEDRGIFCRCLRHIPPLYRVEELEGRTFPPMETQPGPGGTLTARLEFAFPWNPRLATPREQVLEACRAFLKTTLPRLPLRDALRRILVLGTEEFMYPGLLLARELETGGRTVRFHATTRSPIQVCPEEDYPLHSRVPLESFYAPGRRTFLYNLEQYDLVLILTDAPDLQEAGPASLAGALERRGCRDIRLLRWRNDDA